ncbi:MAG: hypothetical protein Q9M14_05340 [Mariprofundaceae bacterium]|nr:hypothetical protein [Mariprofundaceae bacterium]
MRWLLAGLLITMVLIKHAWVWSLAHLLLFFFLMLLLEENFHKVYSNLIKSWRILRWLLIPMIIFHVFFTPGEIVWVGFALPISYEGIKLAFYLGLKLCEMVVCALLLGRLLPMQAWLQATAKVSGLQRHLTPYLRLMPVMLRRVPMLVRRTYRAWCLDPNKIKNLANYMTELIIAMEKDSRKRAEYVWTLWDSPKITALAVQKKLDNSHLGYMGCLLIAYGVLEFGVRYLWN